MMGESLVTMAAYGLGAGGLSYLIGKVSPTITSFKRHLLAGVGPLGAIVGTQIATNEVYVLIGGTLAFGASLAALGVASSVGVARLESRKSGRHIELA
jgi:hypothetical protein